RTIQEELFRTIQEELFRTIQEELFRTIQEELFRTIQEELFRNSNSKGILISEQNSSPGKILKELVMKNKVHPKKEGINCFEEAEA
ncbi:hypothetical protein, partial [Methanosarcina sp.]|uniref:hypothetical protein n=1 Tax=Methanosarcina sp. TaxID=2213 RepID=UPI003BB691DC